jgi:hypothetical protein
MKTPLTWGYDKPRAVYCGTVAWKGKTLAYTFNQSTYTCYNDCMFTPSIKVHIRATILKYASVTAYDLGK